jgi:hypothetical protein
LEHSVSKEKSSAAANPDEPATNKHPANGRRRWKRMPHAMADIRRLGNSLAAAIESRRNRRVAFMARPLGKRRHWVF